MRIVYDAEELHGFFDEAARVAPGHPVLIDSFLEDAPRGLPDLFSASFHCGKHPLTAL
jgi:hypothetical protein